MPIEIKTKHTHVALPLYTPRAGKCKAKASITYALIPSLEQDAHNRSLAILMHGMTMHYSLSARKKRSAKSAASLANKKARLHGSVPQIRTPSPPPAAASQCPLFAMCPKTMCVKAVVVYDISRKSAIIVRNTSLTPSSTKSLPEPISSFIQQIAVKQKSKWSHHGGIHHTFHSSL